MRQASPVTDLEALGAAKYVLLTTFRTTGVGVATPVWIARDGDALVVTTGAAAGKVKRIRANGRATLQACGMRGTPRPSAPVIDASATLAADVDSGMAALRAKYGWQFRLIEARSRRTGAARTIIRLTVP